MEKPDDLLLNLTEMALRTVVANFWSAPNIRDLIGRFPLKKDFPSKGKCWERTVESKVQEKISELVFPAPLKRRMRLIVKPIGLHIPDWMNFVEKCLCDSEETLDIHLLEHLCWTSAGAIHYERTAEKLARLPTLDVVKRFKIACQHCLVESLPVIWQDLPEEFKRKFFEPFFNPTDTNCKLYKKCLLQIYWAYFLKGEEDKLLESRRNFYRHALKFSAKRGNKAATEYFFQKLSNKERDSFLSSKFIEIFLKFSGNGEIGETKCTDALCYLLSQITPEMQIQILKNCPGQLIETFLTWRWHDLFLDKTDLIWKFPHERRTYKDVLRVIRRKVHYSDYYFPELFQEFIRRSPRNFKKYLVNEEILSPGAFPLFSELLDKEDKETARVILSNIDAEDKFRLVSSYGVFQTFESLLERKRHDLVELCVREACQSKEDRKRLKDIFMEFLKNRSEEWVLKWRRFFESIDKLEEIILKKRSAENVTESIAKKIR